MTQLPISKTYHFLAGLPRSGSTVLQSILSQNPAIYASATSPMMDMLFYVESAWKNTTQSLSNGTNEQLSNMYAGVVNGLYHHIPQPIIIDKHRAWARNLIGIKQFFPDAKCICTVRSLPEVVASFVKLVEKQSTTTYVDKEIIDQGKQINTANRAEVIWNNYVYNTWESLKIGFDQSKESLLLVDYNDLVFDPDKQIERIYKFIDLPYYQHTYSSIANKTPEKDEHWGLEGLHAIRPTLKRTSEDAIKILGKDICHTLKGFEFWK